MQTIEFVGPPLAGEDPGLVSPLATVVTLFRRLEEEEQVVLGLVVTEVAQDPQGHGHVDVMTTGVHDPRMVGGKRQARLLRHRQGIDIGPVANCPLRGAPVDQDQDGGRQFFRHER